MIGVVGGGISGLALSHHLRKAGVEHVVLEAEEVPGGVMRTTSVEGIPLDLGPQRTRMTAEVRELVDAVGLAHEVLFAPEELPLWVFKSGRLRRVPLTPREAVTTDLLGWGGKLRILAEPLTGGVRADESVAAFFTRKFGHEAYASFLGPLYGGLYASDPARMMARHGLSTTLREFGVRGSLLLAALRRGRRARQEIATVSFREGLGSLPRALARAAPETVRLATPVGSLEAGGGGFDLGLEGAGSGETLRVERVVLALPAHAAAPLLRRLAPGAAERVERLRYNRLAVVHLRSDCDLRGFGYQVAFGERMETRGVTWNASIFDRDGVYTAYLGGMKNPELVTWDDARIAELAREEFRSATGCDARALLVSRTEIPAWDETWDALADLALPEGVHVCANWIDRPGIPGRLVQARRLAERLCEG